MSPRRSRLEISLKILAALRGEVDKPTRIMYAANMSWKPTQMILFQLVEHSLVVEVINPERTNSKRRYKITEKSIAVLDYFDKAKKILPSRKSKQRNKISNVMVSALFEWISRTKLRRAYFFMK